MLEQILTALIGDSAYYAEMGDFFAGLGDFYAGQAELIGVIRGDHELTQEWDADLGQWVNVDQYFAQPVMPWDVFARP
ncbi:hypothetical protein IEU95_10430 [Hoyosella rhizosphaerae]|uniref:Uncharacterized protein n=1 Tax=Hoyosella rhizosphaerae TaxID=1755582 RepID=A0A916TYM4_9ACTN|nr:hypothetical protein [Hoyosella rhizosphaerae]MBN4927250.1 hypothetical protein [Hoyosella rhizosphaerae]GGC52773.1 hypothetical protein GCM10011410_01360 [Hoyosella rhizosphaerae]